LGDDTTERPAQEVDLGQSERLDELDRTSGECFDGLQRLTCGVADADVVEPDDVTLGRQPVEELRIPPVDRAAEAVQQHERHATARPAAAIGESRGRGIEVEGVGTGGRNVGGHGRCSLCLLSGGARRAGAAGCARACVRRRDRQPRASSSARPARTRRGRCGRRPCSQDVFSSNRGHIMIIRQWRRERNPAPSGVRHTMATVHPNPLSPPAFRRVGAQRAGRRVSVSRRRSQGSLARCWPGTRRGAGRPPRNRTGACARRR
jgi:hypothetical protein